ncbi:UDP-N-acetylmuramate--L-alanine ligase [Striga asiatica]|uniref:UDP-N-acetylmuramate--L-alanine ligase n=1 Tax=Striga asiatica TaxID=4170 RepID=A0A5A7PBY1_STRAF|nr:UDP-N-acetylmuramate--L-alanine ligase [Striga asiatica]
MTKIGFMNNHKIFRALKSIPQIPITKRIHFQFSPDLRLHSHAANAGHNHRGRQANKHPVLHNPRQPQNPVASLLQIPNIPLQIQIDYVIPVVRHVDLPILPAPSELTQTAPIGEQIHQPSPGMFPAEGDNLDGHGQPAAPDVAHQLGFIHDDDEFFAHGFNHFLSKERPAPALDQIQIRVDLVGAVDRQIYGRGDGLLVRLRGGGDADDVPELPLLQEVGDAVDGVPGRGARAEPDDHAGFHVLDGLVGGDFLQIVLRELRRGGGGRHRLWRGVRRRLGVGGQESGKMYGWKMQA